MADPLQYPHRMFSEFYFASFSSVVMPAPHPLRRDDLKSDGSHPLPNPSAGISHLEFRTSHLVTFTIVHEHSRCFERGGGGIHSFPLLCAFAPPRCILAHHGTFHLQTPVFFAQAEPAARTHINTNETQINTGKHISQKGNHF